MTRDALIHDAMRRMAEALEHERVPQAVAQVIADALDCDAAVELLDGDEIHRAGLGGGPSVIVMPILCSMEPIGSIRVTRRLPFDDRDRSLLHALLDCAGISLKNARLLAHANENARRAEEASRLKDEFFAIVSHELRTPLSSVLGWTSVLEKDMSQAAKGIAIIERNARAQQRIVEDMLDVGRIITGKLRVDTEPVDLAAVAREAVESARPVASTKGVDVAFVCAESACRLAGDSMRLRQVVANLISNAIKFTPAGGHVWVEVGKEGDRVVLRVIDTGRGIDPEFLPRVFERFAQDERAKGGGLGLGLAIVRHLVDIHGGHVDVSSGGAGKGSTFTIALPVKPFSAPIRRARPMEMPPSAVPTPRTSRLVGLRVLVVEDEQDSRDLIELLLASEGATVCAADSADAAMNANATFHADVVLSDIGMPGRDGYWLARELRRSAPGTAAVALTAYATNDDIARAIAAGFDHHVAKPVDPEHLVSALTRLRGAPTTTSAA